MKKVRKHLRTPSEGLKRGFTKPKGDKHKTNTSGSAHLCAAIIKGRVRVWHYLPQQWNGQIAEDLYHKVLAPALRKAHGNKRPYTTLEDNDPTGYKSNKAIAAKEELKINPIDFPCYSPDLNPLDFALWSEVEARMKKKDVKGETKVQYLARLKRTALSIPERVVRKMLGAMPARAQSIYDHDGGHIPRD